MLSITYLARINAALHKFQLGHQLSTENNLSLLQLYTAYAQGSNLFEEEIDPENFDTSSDLTLEDDEIDDPEGITVVPQTCIPLSPASIEQLSLSINHPLADCDDFGKQFYLDTVELLHTLMINDGLI